MGRTVCIAGRLFNGLTANDRSHRIYRSQQRSLSRGKGLMLAETTAQTDASDYQYMMIIPTNDFNSGVNWDFRLQTVIAEYRS